MTDQGVSLLTLHFVIYAFLVTKRYIYEWRGIEPGSLESKEEEFMTLTPCIFRLPDGGLTKDFVGSGRMLLHHRPLHIRRLLGGTPLL